MPAPVFVASATAFCDGIDLTITKPAGTAQGDLMVAFVAYRTQNAADTMPSPGWVILRSDWVIANAKTQISYRVAGASEPASYLFTAPSTWAGETVGCIVTIRGIDSSSPFNTTGFSNQSTTCPTVNSTVGDSMVLRLVGQAHDTYSRYEWPAGLTEMCEQIADRGGLFPNFDADLSVAFSVQSELGATGAITPTLLGPGVNTYTRNAYTLAVTAIWTPDDEEPEPPEEPSAPTYVPKFKPVRPCVTVLRSKKVPWAHRSNYLLNPGWLGKNARIESVSQAKGRFDGRYVRRGSDTFGDFNSISRSIQAPSASSVGLAIKERVCDIIHNWRGDIDIDVRLQNCGRVDDPINWSRIKRLCGCVITEMDTDQETIIDADDNGETTINVSMSTHRDPVIVRRVMPKQIPFYGDDRFSDYTFSNIVVGAGPDCGYYVPATDGIYAMFSLAYWTENNEAAMGSGLLPFEPISISSNENVVVVVLRDGHVYWSNDYGKTFYLSTGVSTGVVVNVLSYSNILVGTTTEVYKSTDGGRSFKNADPYHAAASSVVSIQHQDDKLAYILCGDSTISMSEDGGDSFMKMGTSPLGYPKDMIIMDSVLIVGGFDGTGAPVVYGSDDNGCTWKLLLKLDGSIFIGPFTVTPTVKLSSCGCGVVVVSAAYNDTNGLQHSQVYRNVNWGAPNCWELIWEDYAWYANPNGMIIITDVTCSCLNDVMAVGRILGDDPLYVGIRFYTEEASFGEKWD